MKLLKTVFFLLFLIFFSNRILSQDLDTANCNYKRVYAFVEQKPSFPGGEELMFVYIKSHLIMPESAKRDKIEGRVVVQFIIDSIGNVRCPKIIRSISKDCDNEALRLLYNFPQWDAGIFDGSPVNVLFTLPLQFRL